MTFELAEKICLLQVHFTQGPNHNLKKKTIILLRVIPTMTFQNIDTRIHYFLLQTLPPCAVELKNYAQTYKPFANDA